MDTGHLAQLIRRLPMAAVMVAALSSDSMGGRGPPIIAYLGHEAPHSDRAYLDFLRVVRQHHAKLLQNARIEYIRLADGDAAAMDLALHFTLDRRPGVIVASTAESSRLASRMSHGLPLVFATYQDPVRAGTVSSLRSPGSRATGVSLADGLDGKRLEILREAAAEVHSVAVLADRSWEQEHDAQRRIGVEAQRLGLGATLVYAETIDELDALMTNPAAAKFDAWYIPPTYIAYLAEARIIAHLRRLQKPAIYSTTNEVRGGGLMAYEQDTSFAWNTIADLVARVLAGEDPGTIPVERPRRYVLSVRTGPEVAATSIAPSVIRRADQIF